MIRCLTSAIVRRNAIRGFRICEKKSFFSLCCSSSGISNHHDILLASFHRNRNIVKLCIANNSSVASYEFDSRANAKIEALEKLKASSDVNMTQTSEDPLTGAYLQAIKYVSRSKHYDAALYSTNLLSEAIERAGGVFEMPAKRDETESHSSQSDISDHWSDVYQKLDTWNTQEKNFENKETSSNYISRKSFHQVLYAWADSKVRRKGVYANNVLKNMITSAHSSHASNAMPDSKAFAITAKCWSGSTHRYSFQHIIELHKIHDRLADMQIDGIIRDDPFFLMHSIKSVKNYKIHRQEKYVTQWFDRLHTYVTNEDNFNSDEVLIDLTGTYTGIIREHAKARLRQSASKAMNVLNKMKEIKNSSKTIATIEIQQNAYDLLLGALRDSKFGSNSLEAINILDEMVSSVGNQGNSTPIPSLNSFVYCLQSLSFVLDKQEALNLADQVMGMLEKLYTLGEQCPIIKSREPYNALIYLYANIFDGKDELLTRLSGIINLLEESSIAFPDMSPDVKTWSAALRACSVANTAKVTEKERAFKLATEIFERLKDLDDGENQKMTDDCYFHMMKCVSRLSSDDLMKESQIISVFKEAASKGLVSAQVLKMLRTTLSSENYKRIVGYGRLADGWIKNVTSIKATYTDGTKGGPGKNARRQGKSTSDWIKKQKAKEKKHSSKKKGFKRSDK